MGIHCQHFTRATKERFEFKETLSVPIGPDSLMDDIGEYTLWWNANQSFDIYICSMELPPCAALYVSTPQTPHDHNLDVLDVCILNGYVFAHPHKIPCLIMK